MQGFRRRRNTLVAILEHQEIDLVMSLVEQLVSLLNDEALGGVAAPVHVGQDDPDDGADRP